ncbi:CRISPR-associated protein Csx20 [Leptotrichia sp. oral taxon 218]|nr:CRISPR-associated protein Csx20 [Leptotrichia sp. oral taxon 218]
MKCRKIEGDDIMERKALLLFSHQLTENQEKELVENFKVKKIVSLSSELQEMWSNVSIKENYKENLEKIKKYIEENFNENDVMLVQGNWGYTYNIVKWSIEKKLVPVYSYTERNVEEIKDGENVKKISYFKHVKFIEYE